MQKLIKNTKSLCRLYFNSINRGSPLIRIHKVMANVLAFIELFNQSLLKYKRLWPLAKILAIMMSVDFHYSLLSYIS